MLPDGAIAQVVDEGYHNEVTTTAAINMEDLPVDETAESLRDFVGALHAYPLAFMEQDRRS